MNLIKQKLPHWYQHHPKDGSCTPCYELPKKTGPGIKKPTLREAKELRLFPSITNVLDVIAKPALTNWLISQGIMAALTLPRQPDEGDDKFAERVVVDMDSQSQEARDFGTEIHEHVEKYITDGVVDLNSEAESYTLSTRQWINQEVEQIVATEMTVFCPILGLAGRLDMLCRLRSRGLAIVDFKSQEVKRKPNGEADPAFYPEFPMQCAGYGELIRRMKKLDEMPALVSVVIDRAKPAAPHIRIWEDPLKYWELFLNAYALWKYLKGYDPSNV